MFDDKNYIDEIEDLRDQVHDLKQDLQEAEREKVRLEKELSEIYKDDGRTQVSLEVKIKELEDLVLARNSDIARMQKIAFDLDKYLDSLKHNYIKALSVAESLQTNGNMEYFKTAQGKQLIAWAVNELKLEASKIMKEEI